MVNWFRFCAVPLLVLALVLPACGGGGSNGDPADVRGGDGIADLSGPRLDVPLVPDSSPPDHPREAGISVDEGKIALLFEGESVYVDITVERDGAVGPVSGTVSIGVTRGLWSEPLPFQSQPFELADGADSAMVHIKVVALPQDNWNGMVYQLGGTLIHWHVASNGSELSGRRSAWEAHRKLELQLWAPAEVPLPSSNQARLRAVEMETGAPLAGIPVSLEAGNYSPTETFDGLTDATGVWSGLFDTHNLIVVNLTGYAKRGPFVSYVYTQLQTVLGTTKLLLTTDKPLYQPGQTIHMRLMALDPPHNMPAFGEEVDFWVVDPKGNKLAHIGAKTNNYGVASGVFKLSPHLNLGKYDIVAAVGDAQTAKAIKVSRYTLPKFKVGVTLKQNWFQAGDDVEGVVNAYYLFGKPVANGNVEVGTLAADGETPGPFQIVGQTDGEGFLEFSGTLPADLSEYLEGEDGTLYLTVKVTDNADQTQEKLLPLTLTVSPVRIFVIPETEPLLEGVEHQFYLITTDPTGKPIHTQNQVIFEEEGSQDVETDAEGVALFSHTVQGGVNLDVISTADDLAGEASFFFAASGASNGAVVRTDKAVYALGDTIKLTVLSPMANGLVYLDLHRLGRTRAMQAGLLEDGKVSFDVPIEEGWDGELVAAATVFPDSDESPATAQRTLFVHRHKELKVAIAPDKSTYGPGDPLKLDLSVVDEGDLPRQAAVGLTVVDEALYAIQDSKPGLLWKVFEAGGRVAEPLFKHAFPRFDVLSMLGEAMPPAGEALDHFQRLTAAAFAAMLKLDINTTTTSNLSTQVSFALSQSRTLVVKQMSQFESQLAEAGLDASYDSEEITTYILNHSWADPWGGFYQLEDTGSWVLFISAGMDEKFDTDDDLSAAPTMCGINPDTCVEDIWCCPDAVWEWDVSASMDTWDPGYMDAGGGEPLPGGGKAVKVRKWFPETLYVNPAIITDEEGKATVEMPLADSITQWRATGLANSYGGRLGAAVQAITVFQDFFIDPNLPVSYTRNDEVQFPVAVYNYLPEAQAVTVTLLQEDWFSALSPISQSVTIPADSVDAVYFKVRIEQAGWHTLTVDAFGPSVQDAVARQVQVLPGGTKISVAHSGTTPTGSQGSFDLPANLIAASSHAALKFYASGMVHILEGVDSLLKLPYG